MKRISLALISFLFSSVSFALYSPHDALQDALSEPMTFVGWYMPKYSESQKYPNCLFKNSKVLLLAHYCVSQNVPAGSVIIHNVDPSVGYVRFYSEIQSTKQDVSTASRADYLDFLFSVSARITEQTFDPNMSAKDYAQWEERENKNYTRYCVTSKSFEDRPHSTVCKDITSELEIWGPKGYDFWQNSDPLWPKLLKSIKTQVKNLPNYPY